MMAYRKYDKPERSAARDTSSPVHLSVGIDLTDTLEEAAAGFVAEELGELGHRAEWEGGLREVRDE